MTPSAPEIRPVRDASDLETARTLILEYARSLPFGLEFQDFDREVAALPGEYAPPRGCLLLAFLDGAAVGCVAVRPWGGDCCEMKRMYVRPDCRGAGVGRALGEAALRGARAAGYRRMRLDTVPGMEAALAVYAKLGFQPIPPYRHNPIPGAIYLEAELG